MDGLQEARAIEREVLSEDRQGAPARVVVAQREYAASIEDVWDALTNPERLPRWFLPVEGDLTVGGRYQFVGNAGGEVQECEPPDRAQLTWEFGGEVSWLDLRLSQTPGGTRVRLEHVAHVTPERWAEFGPGAVGVGWDLSFYGLGHHLAGGPAFTEAEMAEFHTTAEGRSFIEASSASWVQAAVDGGDEPDAARAAGERTEAFYTGTG